MMDDGDGDELHGIDLYAQLGLPRLSFDLDRKSIDSAFRSTAKKNHPDVCKAPDAEKKFAIILKVYRALCDPVTKSKYDKTLKSKSLLAARELEMGAHRKKLRDDLENREKRSFVEKNNTNFPRNKPEVPKNHAENNFSKYQKDLNHNQGDFSTTTSNYIYDIEISLKTGEDSALTFKILKRMIQQICKVVLFTVNSGNISASVSVESDEINFSHLKDCINTMYGEIRLIKKNEITRNAGKSHPDDSKKKCHQLLENQVLSKLLAKGMGDKC